MQNTRSILLTSGTLSPIDSFKTQLAIPFDVVIQNDHIIEKNQLFAAVLPRAAGNKHVLTSVFRTRQNAEYQEALGQTLHNVIKNIPGGVLVFFPCYKMIEEVVTTWKNNATFEIMNQRKRVMIEQRNKNKFETQMKEFNTIIESDERGAILFAVARGKLSEGIDFSDKSCRAVIIIGIPFAPHQDRRVVAKRQYLDEIDRTNKGSKAGDLWYHQQAFRAINQCVGRVIRHRKDYGAVLFFDQRFEENTDKLSKWLRPFIHSVDYTGMMKGLKDFFGQQSALSLTNQQPTSRPIQQAYFSSVIPTSTTNFNGTKTTSASSSPEIFLPTLKQSNEKHKSIPVEKTPTHKSLFDAISSSQRTENPLTVRNDDVENKQQTFETMLEQKRREAMRNETIPKRFQAAMGTFEEISMSPVTNNVDSPSASATAKTTEYRDLLCQLKSAMPHGVYPRFTHMLQDHKVQKTDRTAFAKLQNLLVENLAKDHFKLFMDMARHISAPFRQEYIEAGQNFHSSSSTQSNQTTKDNATSNKRKDISSDNLEMPSPKVTKTSNRFNPFAAK